MMKRRATACLCALWICSSNALAGGGHHDLDDADSTEAYSVHAMLQTRYQQTAVSLDEELETLVNTQFRSQAVAAENFRVIRDTPRALDGLSIRRALLELGARPAKNLVLGLGFDLSHLLAGTHVGHSHGTAGLSGTLHEAYGTLRVFDELSLSVGLFDVPFSVTKLVAEENLEVAEEGPTYELLHHLRLSGEEVGAAFEFSPFPKKKWLSISSGVFEAAALGGQEKGVFGLFTGQLLLQPNEHLRLGAGLAFRPNPVDAWWEELRFTYQAYDKGLAYNANATLSYGGFVLRGEWMAGDRTDNDVEVPLLRRRGDAETFISAWGLAAFKIPLQDMALTPAVRIEWLDTDREHDVGALVHVTAALNLDVSDHVRILWDLSLHSAEPGTRNWNFTIPRYDPDYITGRLQLQLTL